MSHTLLLADDSVTIQRVIELTFADEDIHVVAVGNGDQAIAVLDKTPPDIVIADVGMPGKNGYEVAQHVKDTPSLTHIPVLLLTGAFEPVDQERAAQAGCDGVLEKPFEPQLVIGRVKELLARPRPTEAAQPEKPAEPPWTAIFDVPTVVHSAETPTESRDEYFDRLDQAFADLSNGRDAEPADHQSRPVADEIDWFANRPETPPGPVAEERTASESAPAAVAEAPGRPSAPPLHIVPPPVSRAPLSLVDAFTALLAAEQAVPPPPPAQPGAAPALAGPAAITEDLVEDITRRVIERLSDRAVRDTVRDIATDVTERLVREEIERIKATIK